MSHNANSSQNLLASVRLKRLRPSGHSNSMPALHPSKPKASQSSSSLQSSRPHVPLLRTSSSVLDNSRQGPLNAYTPSKSARDRVTVHSSRAGDFRSLSQSHTSGEIATARHRSMDEYATFMSVTKSDCYLLQRRIEQVTMEPKVFRDTKGPLGKGKASFTEEFTRLRNVLEEEKGSLTETEKRLQVLEVYCDKVSELCKIISDRVVRPTQNPNAGRSKSSSCVLAKDATKGFVTVASTADLLRSMNATSLSRLPSLLELVDSVLESTDDDIEKENSLAMLPTSTTTSVATSPLPVEEPGSTVGSVSEMEDSALQVEIEEAKQTIKQLSEANLLLERSSSASDLKLKDLQQQAKTEAGAHRSEKARLCSELETLRQKVGVLQSRIKSKDVASQALDKRVSTYERTLRDLSDTVRKPSLWTRNLRDGIREDLVKFGKYMERESQRALLVFSDAEVKANDGIAELRGHNHVLVERLEKVEAERDASVSRIAELQAVVSELRSASSEGETVAAALREKEVHLRQLEAEVKEMQTLNSDAEERYKRELALLKQQCKKSLDERDAALIEYRRNHEDTLKVQASMIEDLKATVEASDARATDARNAQVVAEDSLQELKSHLSKMKFVTVDLNKKNDVQNLSNIMSKKSSAGSSDQPKDSKSMDISSLPKMDLLSLIESKARKDGSKKNDGSQDDAAANGMPTSSDAKINNLVMNMEPLLRDNDTMKIMMKEMVERYEEVIASQEARKRDAQEKSDALVRKLQSRCAELERQLFS